jgi:hypothetical protein
MAQVVPIQSKASQVLFANLGGQNVQLNIYQKSTGLFLDLFVNNTPVLLGVICENVNRIVRDAYFKFAGDFVFLDTQGTDSPFYTGLGTRWVLFYLTAADLAAGVVNIG